MHAVHQLQRLLATLAVAQLGACGSDHKPDSRSPIPAVVAKPIKRVMMRVKPSTDPVRAESVATPVRSARTWMTGLAPNPRGGWNFITESYEVHTTAPSEFFVVDLDRDQYTVFEGETGIYARAQYKSQERAPNGRIFFPGFDSHLIYYEPRDESVNDLGRVIEPPGDNTSIYRLEFGADGKLYGGTQSNKLPTVFQVDPDTLRIKVIGSVGEHRSGYSYAYYLAADPPWLYVAVGENPWELVAIRIDTGESKVLATRADRGFMQFDFRPEGITATLITGLRTPQQVREVVWCADGKTFPFSPGYDPKQLPFRPRTVKPVANPLQQPPEIDTTALNPDARGFGRIYWRPAGSSDPWHEARFQAKYTSPVEIESLIALPDGTLFGNARQYHGFFRYDPKTHGTTYFGQHGPSRGPRAVWNGRVYITGYPNGVLYEYDPSKPWTSTPMLDGNVASQPQVNPRKLGNFAQTGTHYAEALVPSANGRLYYAGRRERDGVGSGVGYFDTKTRLFAGHNQQLEAFDPDGLAVLDPVHEVVLSTKRHDPAQPDGAKLIVYDNDLREVERLEVKPDLQSTGELFATDDPGIVIGVIRRASPSKKQPVTGAATINAVYRYDVAHHRLLDWKDIDAQLGPATQRPSDGSIWIAAGHVLSQMDPDTLEITPAGKLAELPNDGLLVWDGDELYISAGADVRRATLP